MRTFPDCIGCLFAQLTKMAHLHGIDDEQHARMVQELASAVPAMDLRRTPPELSRTVSDILVRHLHHDDPYAEIKRRENARAAAMLPDVRPLIDSADDPLAAAIRFATAGNIIDYGVPDLDVLEHSIEELAARDFATFDLERIRPRLNSARSILVIGDNTGEVFFDRLLIERLPHTAHITYAVRSRPVINDVLLADACEAGIDERATIVESGSQIPGTVPALCSEDFRALFDEADLIISKGQGNFETLSDERRPILFCFAVKCAIVSRHTKQPKGSLMAMASPHVDCESA